MSDVAVNESLSYTPNAGAMHEIVAQLAARLNAAEARLEEIARRDVRVPVTSCRVYRSTLQTAGASAFTTLVWDTVDHETVSTMWTAGANGDKIYAPVTGPYIAGGGFEISAAQIGTTDIAISCQLLLNGTTLLNGPVRNTVSGNRFTTDVNAGTFWMVAGDYIIVRLFNGFGASKDITAATALLQDKNYGWLAYAG